MKCQNLFSGKKNKKNIKKSAEIFTQSKRVVNVNDLKLTLVKSIINQ